MVFYHLKTITVFFEYLKTITRKGEIGRQKHDIYILLYHLIPESRK